VLTQNRASVSVIPLPEQAVSNDAVLRTLQAADIGGIRAILLHATSDDAKRFYERCGFSESPVDPMTLMVGIADVQRILKRSRDQKGISSSTAGSRSPRRENAGRLARGGGGSPGIAEIGAPMSSALAIPRSSSLT
jgi:hypothetical protein